jgi:hypothetical protein
MEGKAMLNKRLKAKIFLEFGTGTDFCAAINEHRSALSRIVRCRVNPTLATKQRYAKALGCTVEEIF